MYGLWEYLLKAKALAPINVRRVLEGGWYLKREGLFKRGGLKVPSSPYCAGSTVCFEKYLCHVRLHQMYQFVKSYIRWNNVFSPAIKMDITGGHFVCSCVNMGCWSATLGIVLGRWRWLPTQLSWIFFRISTGALMVHHCLWNAHEEVLTRRRNLLVPSQILPMAPRWRARMMLKPNQVTPGRTFDASEIYASSASVQNC